MAGEQGRTVRLKTWMRAAILVTSVALPSIARAALLQDPTSAESAQNVPQYVQNLTRTLTDPSTGAQPRTEAAQRLLEVGAPAARQTITNGLTSNDRRVQAACAEAASGAASPDPAWIPPLSRLLGDGVAVEPTARALARFDTNAAAYMALVQYVLRQPPPAGRATVIPVMGQIVQKMVAQALLGLINDPAETVDLRTAAEDALAQLGGQMTIGHDPAGWNQWWNARRDLQPTEWRSRVIAEQHSNLQFASDRASQQAARLLAQLRTVLLEQYEHQPVADRPKTLLGYLNNPDPSIREIGAQITLAAFTNGEPIADPAIHRRLIDLVGDASASVRQNATEALATLADPNALNAILIQLQIEKNPAVKVVLLRAVGRLPADERAVGVLSALLRDPSPQVATVAAGALQAMAPSIRQTPGQPVQVANDLIQVLRQRTGIPGQPVAQPGLDDLRVALINALAPLAPDNDPAQMLNLFSDLLNANEPPAVRSAALNDLAAMHDKGAGLIARELDPGQEPDANVRASAATALGQTGVFAFADQLDTASNNDPSPTVKTAAWKAFEQLLPAGQPQELVDWANRFSRNRRYERQVAVLKVAVKKPQDPKSVAAEEQDIGGIYLNSLHQPDQAIPALSQALDFWQKNNASSSTISPLISQLTTAYLAAHRYDEAIRFAENQIRTDPARVLDVGPPIRNTADELKNNGDYAGARTLVHAALNMDPPLSPSQQQGLKDVEASLPPAATTTP